MDSDVVIPLVMLEKTSRPSNFRTEVRLPSGDNYPPLSLNLCLSEYLDRTQSCRDYFAKAEGYLPRTMFISNNKPYQNVKPATLAKWLLNAMDRSGIRTATYRANSIRSASSSSMRTKGFSLDMILKRANWSPKTRTFSIFYDRSGVSS